MTRRGISLVELVIYIAALGLVLDAAMVMWSGLNRMEQAAARQPADGAVLDAACRALRRDLLGGAADDAGALRAGGHRWLVVDGWLTRDGARAAPAAALRWRRDGRRTMVEVAPAKGATRALAVTPPEPAP